MPARIALQSCWHIVPLYVPPLNILFLAVAISSFAVVLGSIRVHRCLGVGLLGGLSWTGSHNWIGGLQSFRPCGGQSGRLLIVPRDRFWRKAALASPPRLGLSIRPCHPLANSIRDANFRPRRAGFRKRPGVQALPGSSGSLLSGFVVPGPAFPLPAVCEWRLVVRKPFRFRHPARVLVEVYGTHRDEIRRNLRR